MHLTEEQIAQMEAERIHAADKYFEARHPSIDMPHNRHMFNAGFERGYKAVIEAQGNKVEYCGLCKTEKSECCCSIY